jgi:hypothetical protein
VFGLLLWLLLRGLGPQAVSSPASFWNWTASVVVGFNFSVLGTLLVYRWMGRLDTPMDAAFLGMAVTLCLAAAGSFFLARWSSRAVFIAGGICAIVLVPSGFLLPQGALVLAPLAAIFTGTLFPRILKIPDENLVRVYVWETYGLVWGSLAALVVPVLTGFSGLQTASGLALMAAAGAVHRAVTSAAKGEAP